MVILCNWSAFKFATHPLRHNSRGNLSLNLNYYMYDKHILLRGLPCSLKSPCTHFPHFVVHLRSRFYALALIFVFDANIYPSSLRLFKIDPVISLLPATHQQYFILVLFLLLRWLHFTFVLNTLITLKELLFRSSA